jgi:hypothetical protein
MAGPNTFWCNAPALKNTKASGRRFVIMGFSYERGVGEMLESFGHRSESTMNKAFERVVGDANLWQRITRYEKVAPGRSAIGGIRVHHRWWLNHIPHVSGRQNGVYYNWWQYMIDPQNEGLNRE